MFEMSSLGKIFILFGILLIAVGILFMLGGKIPWFGRLPGDIYIQKKSFTLFFPLTTSIILSIIVSVILILIRHK